MNNGLELEAEVKVNEKDGDFIYRLYNKRAQFNRGYNALKSIKAEVAGAKDLIYLTMKKGGGILLDLGSVLREGCLNIPKGIYPPRGGILLLRESLILESVEAVKEATCSHEGRTEFYVSDQLTKRYLREAKQKSGKAILLKSHPPLPTLSFGNDERTIFLFEDLADEIGRFLNGRGKNEMLFYFDNEDTINKHDKAYANQLWLNINGTTARLTGNFLHLGNKECFIRGFVKEKAS